VSFVQISVYLLKQGTLCVLEASDLQTQTTSLSDLSAFEESRLLGLQYFLLFPFFTSEVPVPGASSG